MAKIDELKEEARKLLREGKVKYIIGYTTGTDGWSAVPAFIKTPEEVDRLVWDPTCVHNLTKFLVDEKRRKSPSRKPDTRPAGSREKVTARPYPSLPSAMNRSPPRGRRTWRTPRIRARRSAFPASTRASRFPAA